MIPPEKQAAVSQALNDTFGVTQPSAIFPITTGLSADLIFEIQLNGSSFLLRLMMRIDERNNPARIFAVMHAAAQAALAPAVLYTNQEHGISITHFIHQVPLFIPQAAAQLPQTLRSLHALAPFPKVFNYVTMHDVFIWRFRQSSLLPSNEIEEAFHHYGQITAAYPLVDSDLVSCHNDLKPENILFDGQRIWLVDWQAAFVNDRYFDLAILANFLANTEAEAQALLEQYFNRPATAYEQARFYLMRQALHMMYAAVFFVLGSPTIPQNIPGFNAFHQSIWDGEINLAEAPARTTYAKLHWQRFLDNARQPNWQQALQTLQSHHATNNGFRPLLPPLPSTQQRPITEFS